MKDAAISIEGLRKCFPGDGGEQTVFGGIDLTIRSGEFVCILGPTGCGKTTLLRLLTRLEKASAGTIAIREGRVGMVFQQNALLPWRRVLHNVTFPLELAGVKRSEARARARELLALVRLKKVESAFPWELSGGMQQRVAIARALAAESGILLLDEPFGALDDPTRIALQEMLLEVWRERDATVLFVTHNIEEALVLADRILVLGDGRILGDEPVELPRPRDRFSSEFVEAFVRLRRTFAGAVFPESRSGS
jgi:NitT/TauT family transport system ATP-binding protein